MKVFTTRKTLRQHLQQRRNAGKTIGLVATMGALHAGHLSLIEQARQTNDEVVCSIFVNPTQFNDPKDLEKYPRTIDADTRLLEQAGCDILFAPTVNEIYDGNEQWHFDIGEPEFLLEGKFRPGHYQGVTHVVYLLFDIIKPDTAFFGQKDYQQFLIISLMVEKLNIPVELVMSPIMREPDGLAMSSRNVHLTAEDRRHALVLSRTLGWVNDHFERNQIVSLKKEAENMIGAEEGVELDYFEIVDGATLRAADSDSPKIVALVAARVGKTRLIDNMILAG